MKKEIKLKKRKPTFDYMLNDLAFDSLMFRVVNNIASYQDKFDFDYQIKLMQKEISRLRKNIYNAIEYINENKHLSMFADCREPEEDWNYDLEINPRELLNILKGDKNE